MSVVETERLRFRSTLAALCFHLTLVGAELKFRAGQSRVPKGQAGGGRFADEGHGSRRSGGSTTPAVKPLISGAAAAARAAMANPEAAIIVGAAAGPLGMGAVGISRAAGLATQPANGGCLTPILKSSYSEPHAFINRGGGDVGPVRADRDAPFGIHS